MINRDLIRIKVVQLAYAYIQNGEKDLTKADKELELSLSKAYQLYNNLLLLICAVTKMARKRYDIIHSLSKRDGRKVSRNNFIKNKFALQLLQNMGLRQYVESYGDPWEQRAEFVKNLLLEMEEDEVAETKTGIDYEIDKTVWKQLYKKYIQENENLDDVLEWDSLYWNGDKGVIDTFVLKTITKFDEQMGDYQPLLPEFKDEADKEFAKKLLYVTLKNSREYQQYIREACQKWDFARLACMDVVIMEVAIAEMLNFQQIPVPVTINEYVELANEYSTPKSGRFVNGILDAIAKDKNIKIKKLI